MDKKRNFEDMEAKPKGGTEEAVASALKEADEKKKAKKVKFSDCVLPLPKVREPDELPAEPQGPIMEGMVEVAAEKRSIERLERKKQKEKNMGCEDTSMELGSNTKDAEEAFQAGEDEDAAKFEPFNLDDEREHGFFDGQGNYVEYKEEKHSADAWLEGVKVDEKLAQKTLEAAQAAEDPGEDLSGAETARLQRRIADILHEDETVLQALKRLGKNNQDPAVKAQFDDLTESANILMANGEYEVYTDTRRVFERSAALFEPAVVAAPQGDCDMFADSDDEDAAPPPQPQAGRSESHKAASGPTPPTTSAAAADSSRAAPSQVTTPATAQPQPQPDEEEEEDTTDYSSWPIGELRRFVEENGDNAKDIVEKPDLIERARKTARRLQLETKRSPASSGYIYQGESGYYVNNDTGLFYDIFTDGFFNPQDSKWYSYNSATGAYVEWETQKPDAATG